LYDLVSDVDQYHHFVPWCASSRVLSVHPNQNGKVMRAELGIGFKALSETYVSRVECVDGVSVKALAQDSSVFRQLNTTWKFTPVRPTHNTKLPPSFPQSTAAPASSPFDTPTCAVDFHIAFEFKSPLYAQVSTLFFEEVSKAMMGAFEDRARVVYGRP
ncbi:cyclase/dehydrase, partial [Powellomyces hirtus]